MKDKLTTAILKLWHISRTALAGTGKVASNHDRMIYINEELKRSYPTLVDGMGWKAIWFAIEEAIS